MLKVVGAGMVIFAGSLAGLRTGGLYARRPKELRALMGTLLLLQTEIGYAALPLREALAGVAARGDSKVAALFRTAGGYLDGVSGLAAGEAWAKALREVEPDMALREEDIDILHDLGAALGNSDREDQARHIALALERLRAAASLSEEDARRYVRLYNFLGIGAGLGLAVLFS